ncbi:DUF4224 domain-containing protein [Iodobacter sp.]|uniref:DUF4224 domain-containing protein n=1 Tax=Iodobacter sp. TaxID=1915058 RepID=UPI0025DE8FB7|nr:DUF4224 domain-containing protein [Iodobacter sp.]
MGSIRINKEELVELTGKHQKGAQVKWFKEHLLVDISCDTKGPIINQDVYSALLQKRYGLLATMPTEVKRPQVQLRKS